MKVVSQVLIVCLLCLFFWNCGNNDGINSGSAGDNGTDKSLVVIPAKELAPYEGLYYNKKTKKPFTGRVDEYFPFQGSEKRVRVSRHLKEGKMHGLRTQYYNDGKKFIEIEYSGGRKNGRAVNWHRNGQVQWERTFKSDQLHGDSIRYDSEGNITQHVIYKMGQVEKALK